MARTQEITATIANGQSLSDAVALGGACLIGLYMPAAWTAAVLTLVRVRDGTEYPVEDADGTETTITVEAGKFYQLPAGKIDGVESLKIRSGTSAAAVNQGASRSVVLVYRGYD